MMMRVIRRVCHIGREKTLASSEESGSTAILHCICSLYQKTAQALMTDSSVSDTLDVRQQPRGIRALHGRIAFKMAKSMLWCRSTSMWVEVGRAHLGWTKKPKDLRGGGHGEGGSREG